MPVATLTYFRGRGRAQTTRWMLAATGVQFTNAAIDTPEELAALRASGKLEPDDNAGGDITAVNTGNRPVRRWNRRSGSDRGGARGDRFLAHR